MFGRKEVPALPNQTGEELSVNSSSRYQWAIQHYESGHYEAALEGFNAYENDGALISNFPMIPYYQGMSHFRLGNCTAATPYLQKFIEASPTLSETQEARLTLLQCYEKREDWKAVVTLAAEIEKFPLYAENRIRLKLLWTRALFELNEISGAKRSLEEVEGLVNNFTRDPDRQAEFSQNNESFESRLFHLKVMLELEDCEAIAAPTKSGKNSQALVDRWLETKGDCLVSTTRKSLDLGLTFKENEAKRWLNTLASYYQHFADSPEQLTRDKLYSSLKDAQFATRAKIRAALYRLAATIDTKLKEKDSSVPNTAALLDLQKTVENLLLSLSLLS